MQNRNLTVRRRAACARARVIAAAETRRIRHELAGLPGVEGTGLLPFLLAATGAAGRTERPTLHLAMPGRQWLVPPLPWPEEAPDQHRFAPGEDR